MNESENTYYEKSDVNCVDDVCFQCSCFAGEVDSLIEKLVDKKILSPEEVRAFVDETKIEMDT